MQRKTVQLSGKGLLQVGVPVLPETWTAPHQILPEPGLRFMDAQGDGVGGGKAVALAIQPLFVKAVSGFMNHSEDGHAEVCRVVAGRDPNVARGEARAEGMGGLIETPGVPVKPHGRHHPPSEPFLLCNRVVPLQKFGGRLLARPLDPPQQVGQARSEAAEDLVKMSLCGTRLVLVEQGVIPCFSDFQAFRFLALEADDAGQPGGEGCEVRSLAGRHPGVVGEAGRPGQFTDQSRRQSCRLAVQAPGFPHISLRPGVVTEAFYLVR